MNDTENQQLQQQQHPQLLFFTLYKSVKEARKHRKEKWGKEWHFEENLPDVITDEQLLLH